MHHFPRYEHYKDSGVAWLGEIPAHWELKPLKAVLVERKESNDPIKTREILSLSMDKGVTLYSDKGRGGNKAKEDITAYKLAYPNDIVLNSMNVIVGSVGLSQYFGAVSPVYYTLYARYPYVSIKFCDKLFQNPSFQMSLFGLGNGILIKKSETSDKLNTIRLRIPMDKLNKVLLPLPPLAEQTAIAEFLDQKTAQIDRAITQKEKLIALLQERRQILIHQAVTRGLNPTAPMKDSGVAWIGQIPAHWEVTRVKNVFRLITEPAPNNNDHELLSVYTDIGVKPRRELEERGNKASTTDGYWLVKKGDIVVNKLLAWMGAIGVSDYEGVTSPAYDILRAKRDVSSEYFHFLFRSDICVSELKKHSRGIMDMRLRLYFDKFADVMVPVPPMSEQKEIVAYIHRVTNKIATAITCKQNEIEKLKEYKATLINSAVTGKIKIPA